MEQKLPVLAQRFWDMIRVAIFMLKKGISKSKLLFDLNLMMKRGKIAGKAMLNLMFHHSHHRASTATTNKRKMRMFSGGSQSPGVVEDDYVTPKVVMKALEMLQSEAASPALPGFGRTPMVRQLRITDSPFPLNYGVEGENYVDEAAEDFINKFYKDLIKQNKGIVS